MATSQEHRQAFDVLANQLRQSLQFNVRAQAQPRGGSAKDVLRRHFDHTLDRIADLYGRGVYENLTIGEIISSAIHGEALLAFELQRQARSAPVAADEATTSQLTAASANHIVRARALIDVSRRAVNVHVASSLPVIMPYRGVYLIPFTQDVHNILRRERDPFVRWNEGAVAAVQESKIAELQRAGAAVALLYYNSDELHDDAAKLSRADLESEFGRRLARARTLVGDGVGDAFPQHRNALLLHQSTVLRNLQARLFYEHPVAHQSIKPIVDQNRELLEAGLRSYPSWLPDGLGDQGDDLGRLIELERSTQAHAAAWVAHGQQDDGAGYLDKFEHFVRTGSMLDELAAARTGG